jgi:hypothetical protein
MNHELIRVHQSVDVVYVGVPKAFAVSEAQGLRSADATRPGDLVAMDFYFAYLHYFIFKAMKTTLADLKHYRLLGIMRQRQRLVHSSLGEVSRLRAPSTATPTHHISTP